MDMQAWLPHTSSLPPPLIHTKPIYNNLCCIMRVMIVVGLDIVCSEKKKKCLKYYSVLELLRWDVTLLQ